MENQNDQWITSAEAQELTGISRQRLYQLRGDNRIKWRKLSTTFFQYERASLLRWMASTDRLHDADHA